MTVDKTLLAQDFKSLIAPLCEIPGPSGFEDEVAAYILTQLKGYNVEIQQDTLGNVIVHKQGQKKQKVLVSAHMDEIGLIIRHIDKNGFLWVETLGGIAPQQFFGKRVIVKTDTGHVEGIVQSLHPGRPDRCTVMPDSVHDFYIDVGADSSAQVLDMGIEPGNAVSLWYPTVFLGPNRVAAKALDDRALVFVLLETLKLLEQTDEDFPDFYALFSVQEEIGARGAIVAATNIKPDYAIALDMSLSTDIPGVQERNYINTLGKGTSIKVMDKLSTGVAGIISDRNMVAEMKRIAQLHNIPYQVEAYAAGATDASFMQTLNGGIKSGGIQIPMRYVHSYEVCDIRDTTATVELLYYYLCRGNLL